MKIDQNNINLDHPLLQIAIDEERERRHASVNEIVALENYFINQVKQKNTELNELHNNVINELQSLKAQMIEVNKLLEEYTEQESWQLRTNKNVELIDYTLTALTTKSDLLECIFAYGFMSRRTTPNGEGVDRNQIANFDNPDDNLGNSYRSAIVVALLTSLSVINNKSIVQLIAEDFSTIKIHNHCLFDMNTSPNIQDCAINSDEIKKHLSGNSLFNSKNNSLISLGCGGYHFGGSDDKYQHKKFKFEDCSSVLAKWLRLKVFDSRYDSTQDFEKFYNDTLEKVKPELYADFQKTMTCIDITDAKPGDILSWRAHNRQTGQSLGGHIGVITDVDNFPTTRLGFISYARDIPLFEGIGYMSVNIEEILKNKCRTFTAFRALKQK